MLSANPKTANPKREWKKDEENIEADSKEEEGRSGFVAETT
jgi:hypothetical protein